MSPFFFFLEILESFQEFQFMSTESLGLQEWPRVPKRKNRWICEIPAIKAPENGSWGKWPGIPALGGV